MIRLNLLHPFIVYSITWFSVVFLYTLKWSNVLVVDSFFALIFFLQYLYLPFLFGLFYSYLIPFKANNTVTDSVIYLKESNVKKLFFIFLILTFFEIVVMNGFPLLWVIIGDTRGYVDYGIPSFHGLVNALHLTLLLIFFYKAIQCNASWFPFVLLTVWNIFMFNRFMIMISLVQVVALYLLLNRLSLKRFFLILSFIITVLFLFGLAGDIRSGLSSQVYESFFGLDVEKYPDFLPRAYIWPYLYITTPFNNLVSWVDFNNFNYSFSSVYSGLFPSVIRSQLFTSVATQPSLVSETFNMSTGYAPALIDMGTPGLIIFNFLIGMWISIQWRYSRGITNFFSYSVSITCLFYLIFFNTLFTLPVIFQFIVLRFLVSYSPAAK